MFNVRRGLILSLLWIGTAVLWFYCIRAFAEGSSEARMRVLMAVVVTVVALTRTFDKGFLARLGSIKEEDQIRLHLDDDAPASRHDKTL